MSLAGQGAVAIWNDIAPEGRSVFYAWHGREHVPERVGIAGFLRGRRYVAIHGSPEYFTLYEVDTPQTLTGQDYASRLNNPTPWTLEAVGHFRNVARSICRVACSFGNAQGGLIATWRYDVAEAAAEDHRRALAQRLLPEIVERPGIAGAHLLVADIAASAVDTEERKKRGEPNRVPRWILLVESWDDAEPFDAFCREALSDIALAGTGASAPAEYGLYRLQLSRAKLPWSAG
ncbi:MAG TPA: hypothetical protein VKY65_06070 [Alphaproteobacteria bacterium]|nr:hypothetical protein [Alphaproteobacteria bacterium]